MSEPLTPADLAHLRHDLRTPFNHLLGYSEMLIEMAEDDNLADCLVGLRALLAESKSLLDLLNEVLGTGREIGLGERRALGAALAARLPGLVQNVSGLQTRARQPRAASLARDLDHLAVAVTNLDHLVKERLLDARPGPTPAASEPAAPAPATEGAAGPAAKAGRVLVVDDVAANRDLLCRRLQREGYAVDEAEDGRVALAKVRTGAFDLVLLDIMMPEVDGYEVLRQVKSDAVLRDVPVVMISALDEIESVVRCIEMGAEDYLPKPFDPVLLRARVGACVEKKRLRDRELAHLRGVAAVEAAAAAVEAGAFNPNSLVEVAGRADELGRLARVFQKMAREVQAREQQYKAQVEQLRIEIDVARKTKQVAEITEGEFFNRLAAKAKALKDRVKPGE